MAETGDLRPRRTVHALSGHRSPLPTADDERGGQLVVWVSETCSVVTPASLRQLFGARRAAPRWARPTRSSTTSIDRHGAAPRPDAEGLEDRLLRGKTGRQTLGSIVRVAALTVGEESLGHSGTTLERGAKAGDVDQVDADAFGGHYSTVTVLARLRGRSTLRPSPRAMA